MVRRLRYSAWFIRKRRRSLTMVALSFSTSTLFSSLQKKVQSFLLASICLIKSGLSSYSKFTTGS